MGLTDTRKETEMAIGRRTVNGINAKCRSIAKQCSDCPAVILPGDEYGLTVENRLTVRRCKLCARKAYRNSAARARSEAMRSVGMVRNRDGSWE
jgi:hypothetical protein